MLLYKKENAPYSCYFEHNNEKLNSMGCSTAQLLGNSKPVIGRNIKIENKTNIKTKTVPKMMLASSSFFFSPSHLCIFWSVKFTLENFQD